MSVLTEKRTENAVEEAKWVKRICWSHSTKSSSPWGRIQSNSYRSLHTIEHCLFMTWNFPSKSLRVYTEENASRDFICFILDIVDTKLNGIGGLTKIPLFRKVDNITVHMLRMGVCPISISEFWVYFRSHSAIFCLCTSDIILEFCIHVYFEIYSHILRFLPKSILEFCVYFRIHSRNLGWPLNPFSNFMFTSKSILEYWVYFWMHFPISKCLLTFIPKQISWQTQTSLFHFWPDIFPRLSHHQGLPFYELAFYRVYTKTTLSSRMFCLGCQIRN